MTEAMMRNVWQRRAARSAGAVGFEQAASLAGLLALVIVASIWGVTQDSDQSLMAAGLSSSTPSDNSRSGLDTSALSGAVMAGGYAGISKAARSTVEIKNPGRTDMTVKDFDWNGRPFKLPPYYGLRAVAWPAGSRFGAMVDFTHDKTIANFDSEASFTGMQDGKPLAPKAKVGDVFKHLEFSHGHNMLTLNGLARIGTFASSLSPYAGIGAGVSLPHTEIGFRNEDGRTYEYQYAGLVGQALAGIEVKLGRASIFIEYKFTYAPYDVPLSGVVNGSWLFIDLWRQLQAYLAGKAPPGGRLRTTLQSHHAIAGVLVRAGRRPSP